MLEVDSLSVQIGSVKIISDISFSLSEGQWLMVVGPNGAGKSTLISAISNGVEYSGDVRFDGASLKKLKPSNLAKLFGVLMQSHTVGYSFTVDEVVKLGRYAYSSGIFGSTSDEDGEKIEWALEATGMVPMRGQSVLTLSGGELQRTFLAQLLAQDPKLLLLDEPSNHLDLVYQKQVFELIAAWLKQPGRAVISVVHDLSLALAYGSHAILLNKGQLIASGSVSETLAAENLRRAYDMDVYEWMRSMLSQWA